jgi:hypothetical protein
VLALTTFAQSPEPASLKIGNARGQPLLFVLCLFIFSSCIFGFLGSRVVFFWICFIYVFKIEDWPSIDEYRTPSLFSSGSDSHDLFRTPPTIPFTINPKQTCAIRFFADLNPLLIHE